LVLLQCVRDKIRHGHDERDAAAERSEKLPSIETKTIRGPFEQLITFRFKLVD
jgi:hypothetical protein